MSTLNCFKDREAKAFALKSTKFSFKITQKGKTKNQLQKMKTGTRPHALLKQPFALASDVYERTLNENFRTDKRFIMLIRD